MNAGHGTLELQDMRMPRVGSTLRVTVHSERNQTGIAPWRTLRKWLQERAMRKLRVRAEEALVTW